MVKSIKIINDNKVVEQQQVPDKKLMFFKKVNKDAGNIIIVI